MENITHGFTLIELLIVIFIISVLAIVLIPNLMSARQRSYDSIAQSCVKSLANGAAIWKIDNPMAVGYPAASDLYGDELKTQKYGTNPCNNSDVAISGNSITTNSSYLYTSKHANGLKTFTATEGGIVAN